jgi:hypothetical protein
MLHLKEEDTSYYYKVREQALKYEGIINQYEITDTYINLENYCKKRVRKGHNDFLNELFDILKIEIEKKLYMIQGNMSAKFYRCVVDTALKLNKFDWTLEFIEKYRNKLLPAVLANTYIFSLALYEFAMKNFESSLELLSKVKYDEVYQKIELRSLMAELYYELWMEESLFAHIDSFRHFLSNDKLLPAERKKYFCSFLKHLRNLTCLKDKHERSVLFSLKKQIKEDDALYNKDWLLKKVKELEKISV